MSTIINKNNINNITHKELVEVIKRVYHVKLSAFVLGKIGIGKSDTIREASRQLSNEFGIEFKETKTPNQYPDHFCLYDLRLAEKDVGEVLGLPENYTLVKKNGNLELIPTKALDVFISKSKESELEIVDYVTRWSMPSYFPRHPKSKGIIFADEMNLAVPMLQTGMYQLINDRALGDYYLPDGWVVIGAGNRGVEDGAPIFDFPAPLKNRFIWYELKQPTVEDWTSWAAVNNIDMRIIGFINVKRSALYNFNFKSKENAFCTPRSWTKVSKMIKGINDQHLVELFTSGVIGEAMTGEFSSYLKISSQLPPTEDFIDNPKKMALPERGDLLYTLCANLAEYYIGHKDIKKNDKGMETLRSITILADRLWKESKKQEYSVFLLKLIKTIDSKSFNMNIVNIDEFGDLSIQIRKYLL